MPRHLNEHTPPPPASGADVNPDPPPLSPTELAALEERLVERSNRRDAWIVFTVVFAAIAMLVAVIAVGFGSRAIDDSERRVKTSGTAAPAAGHTAPTTATVHLSEFKIEPKDVTVAQGATLQVVNAGTMPHNLAVKGTSLTTKNIAVGGTDSLPLAGLAPGTYTIHCTIPGHEQAGMVATLHVAGDATAAAVPAAHPGTTAVPVASSSSPDATIDFGAAPSADWHAFDPTLKPAEGATVHNVTFHATERVLEVAPGVKQRMWTFNGQVPGPVLRGHLGDVFNVTLVNDATMGHSIDFHASKVSPDVQMRTIQPGESLVYQFKADYAGIWMYHCGTAPILDHIGNGMYGAVIVDPPDLPTVDHEYVMIQSELYLGPQGQPGDYAKMVAATPDAVVFNGYVNQYKFAPIKVGAGQRERVWVLDAGPNENSSFHIVGTIFDTVFKEGTYELRPDATRGGSQSLDLQPAQGGFVAFTLNDVGQYPMITHKFANVGKGALGLFQVGDRPGATNH
jgi:nitrite reductase (NO-forming)